MNDIKRMELQVFALDGNELLDDTIQRLRESIASLQEAASRTQERRVYRSLQDAFSGKPSRPMTEHERRAAKCPSCGACEGEKLALIRKSNELRDLNKKYDNILAKFCALKQGVLRVKRMIKERLSA